jgi:hypothetical protein
MDFQSEEPDDMSHTLTVQWTIEPQTAPRPWLACSRCRRQRPFESSGKTRLNANGQRLDAWLIYRCNECDDSWNRPIFERRNVRDISPALLDALQNNDGPWIRRFAFDIDDLRRSCDRVEEFSASSVMRRALSGRPQDCTHIGIDLIVAMTASLRLDRLLSAELGLSRARLARLVDAERLVVTPSTRKGLQRPIRNGTRIVLDLSSQPDRAEIIERALAEPPPG